MTEKGTLGSVLEQLFATIEDRKDGDGAVSYTASLLKAGPARCAKKFGEEAIEAALAGALQDREELTAEAADVLYHLLVLMAANEVALEDVASELQKRTSQSGHAEKASR